MLAAALQAAVPAFQAMHAAEHAAHDAKFAAAFGDLSHQTLRSNAPVHEHEPGETCGSHCASCKVQARLAVGVTAGRVLVSSGLESRSTASSAAAAAPLRGSPLARSTSRSSLPNRLNPDGPTHRRSLWRRNHCVSPRRVP